MNQTGYEEERVMVCIDYTEEQMVALGGLLHDIGKLLSRCDSSRSKIGALNGKHQESSKQFLRWLEQNKVLKNHPVLEEIVQRHHESYLVGEAYEVKHCKDSHTRKLAYIVSRADSYSSKDRREEGSEGKSNYKTRALDCVLAHLSLEEKEQANEKLHYQLKPFSYTHLMPRAFEGNTQDDLQGLIHEFIKDLKLLEFHNFDQLFTGLNTLLQRYTWCIPADTTKKISDVSLYEHLKTTSAFAQCLYRYYKETGFEEKKIKAGDDAPTLAILAMEIDGLGEYTRFVATSTKANKRLKGKVAYGNLLKQAIKLKLLKALNLTPVCSIWEQEDKIYLVLPNLEKDKKLANSILKQVNEALYSTFDGQLHINSCILPTSGNEIQKFNELLSRIGSQLKAARKDKWREAILLSPITRSFEKSVSRCPVCDENTVTAKENMCSQCELEITLGTHIESYNLMRWHFEEQEEIDPVVTLLKGLPQVEFVVQVGALAAKETPLVLLSEYVDLEELPVTLELCPTITPIDKYTGEVKTLEELAEASVGVPYLGVLKCEIKDLDLLYRYGLVVEQGADQEDSTSISRLCTINMLLQTFFKGFIQNEVNWQTKKSISFKDQRVKIEWGNHTIVSANEKGLTLIGPWNELPAVAEYIRRVVHEITGHNEQIKLYVAMSLLKKKQPLKPALEKAQNLLHQALEDQPGMTLFETHLPWKQLEAVVSYGELIASSMMEGILSQSFVYRLKNYANQMESYGADQNIEHLMYMSHLTYDISRNLKGNQSKEKEVVQSIKKLYFLEESQMPTFSQFKMRAKTLSVILNYAVYKQRGE